MGSFFFLPFFVTFTLALLLLCLKDRYYLSLCIFFFLDLTGEATHPVVFTVTSPFSHLYFPLTVFGIIVFFVAKKARQFVWVDRITHI